MTYDTDGELDALENECRALAKERDEKAAELQSLRERADRMEKALRFIRDECDWEEPRGDFGGGGDSRIGPAIDAAMTPAATGADGKRL